MMIRTVLFIFIELHFKKYECPNVTVRNYFISKKVLFYVHYNYSILGFLNPVVLLMYTTNTMLGRQGFPSSLSPLYLCFPLCLLCVLPYSLHVYLQTGATALIVASGQGQFEVVKLLIERGANVNISTNVRYMFVLILCVCACVWRYICMCWCNQIVNVHHC